MDPDIPDALVMELELLNVNFFINQTSLKNTPDDFVTSETLIVKKGPTCLDNSNIEDFHDYILPKYIRCFSANQILKSIRRNVCTVSAKITITPKEKPSYDTVSTGTAFLFAPFKRNSTNYVFTCAHCVIDHCNAKDSQIEFKEIAISFTSARDIFDRTDSISCTVYKHGKYEPHNISEDWAILSFDGDDLDESLFENGLNLIPSPSSVFSLNTNIEPEEYNIMSIGLCSPSENVIEKKAKEMNMEPSILSKMIPKEGHEISLGWSEGVKDTATSSIYHTATTTESCSGSPILSCSISISDFIEKSKQADILQKTKCFKDYIQSIKFSPNVVGIHCGHTGKSSRNVGCSVLCWFDLFYDIYKDRKPLFFEEEQLKIEKEKVFFDNWKQKKEK